MFDFATKSWSRSLLGWFSIAIVSIGLISIASDSFAQAAPEDRYAKKLMDRLRSSIVSIKVTGEVDTEPESEFGTGFLIDTSKGPRIITAGHVVGFNDKWDPGTRLIYLRFPLFGTSDWFEPVTDALTNQSLDLAQIYVDPYKYFEPLKFRVGSSSSGENNWPSDPYLFVPSWLNNWRRAKMQPVQVLDENPALWKTFRVSGTYKHGFSGSPVLDGEGKIVGVVVQKAGKEGIAVPLVSEHTVVFAGGLSLIDSIEQWINNPVEKTALPQRTETDLSAIVDGCVLLGKRSTVLAPIEKDMPFGLSVFESLNNASDRNNLVDKRLTLVTGAKLRSKCPDIEEGDVYYGRTVAQLLPGDEVEVQSIEAYSHGDDVFYWATLTHVKKRE